MVFIFKVILEAGCGPRERESVCVLCVYCVCVSCVRACVCVCACVRACAFVCLKITTLSLSVHCSLRNSRSARLPQ